MTTDTFAAGVEAAAVCVVEAGYPGWHRLAATIRTLTPPAPDAGGDAELRAVVARDEQWNALLLARANAYMWKGGGDTAGAMDAVRMEMASTALATTPPPAPDAKDARIARLEGVLRAVAGGEIPGGMDMVLSGNWHAFATATQTMARTALAEATP